MCKMFVPFLLPMWSALKRERSCKSTYIGTFGEKAEMIYILKYGHYSTPGSGCYNKLFEYQASDEQVNEAIFQAMII